MDFFKDLPLLTWEYLKSRQGKKCLRGFMMPIIVFGSMIMLIVGAIWAKYQFPECGLDYESSKFKVQQVKGSSSSSSYRRILGNSCPGYDWKHQKSPFTAGEHHFDINVPIKPSIAQQSTSVSEGLIGYAMNGVPIFASGKSNISDAVKVQAGKFDACGGSDSNPIGFTFDLPVTGFYHYFSLPGDGAPLSHASSLNLDYALCVESLAWYVETNASSHSPMAGIMADGIPIYGPKAANGGLPTDLDECGGHSSDLPFYHYHFTSIWPYSVKCLKGCLDGSFNSALNSGNCAVNASATLKSNFSSIANLTYSYGGAGVNSTDWSGPACLLIFGFIIFIPGMLCCICMMCGKNISKMHDKKGGALAGRDGEDSEFDDDDDDDSRKDTDSDYEWVTDDEADEEENNIDESRIAYSRKV